MNRPGQWLFRVGPVADDEEVELPDKIEGELFVLILEGYLLVTVRYLIIDI